MKKRSLRWVLLAAVVLIWTLVIMQIVNGVQKKALPDGDIFYSNTSNGYKAEVDSFSLILDYRNPFNTKPLEKNAVWAPLIHSVSSPKGKSSSEKKDKTKEAETIKVEFPDFVYHGLVKEKQQPNTAALIVFDGVEYIVEPGQAFMSGKIISYDAEKLVFNMQDSIRTYLIY